MSIEDQTAGEGTSWYSRKGNDGTKERGKRKKVESSRRFDPTIILFDTWKKKKKEKRFLEVSKR